MLITQDNLEKKHYLLISKMFGIEIFKFQDY